MKTTPTSHTRRFGQRLFSRARAVLAVSVLAALAVPNRSLAQAPTFNALKTTYTGNPNFEHPQTAGVGDFNGDGKLDALVSTGSSNLRLMLGNGDGTFNQLYVSAPGTNPGPIKAVDLNGDGRLDAITVSNQGNLAATVLLNTGNDASGVPQFTVANYTNPGFGTSGLRSLTVGDLNGDGKPDFVVGDANGALRVWLNNGDGTFTGGQYYGLLPGAGGPSVGPGVIADFNGDGKADYLVTSNQNHAINIFFGNGDGTFQPTPAIIPATDGMFPVVADLNKDGKPDFLAVDLGTGMLQVYLNTGNGTFSSPTLYSTGLATPCSLVFTDMNGDGKMDVVTSDFNNGSGINNVAVLPGNGDGTFGAANLYNSTQRATDLSVGDFNGDGKPDIATVGLNDDTYGVLLNTTPSGPPPATPPVIFTRTTVTAEGWNKYTVNFIPTQSGNYTLGFNLAAGGPSGDNSILIDAVKVTSGGTTLFADGFESPSLATNTGSASSPGNTLTIGNWAFTNYGGILNGSPPNWGLAAQGLGSADGTVQYAYIQAAGGALGKMKSSNTLALVAGQTYTVTYDQASRRDFGGQVTYNVTIDQVLADTTPPVITSPGNIVAEATSSSGAAVTFSATATDDVDGAVSVIASPASGSTFPLGDTTVGLAASDAAHNTASASFTVTVRDTTPPGLLVPAAVVAEATSANGAVVTYAAATASDAVGVASVTYSKNSGTQFPLGTTTVNVTAKDAANNATTLPFTVTVRDTTAPAITAPANQTVEATSAAGAVATFSASATDAVGVASLTYSAAPGSTFALGVSTVTVTAKDASNNASSATFTITVRDTTAPVISAPANIIAEATSAAGAIVTYTASVSDAVGATLTASKDSGTVFPIGTTTVALNAADAAGNAAAPKTFTVTVRDTTGPVITAPNVVAEASGDDDGTRVTFAVTALDAVSGLRPVTLSRSSGSRFPLGVTTVTATSKDALGNTTTVTFTVTVRDTTAPTIDLPKNMTVSATSAAGAKVNFKADANDAVSDKVTLTYSPAPGSVFPLGTTTVTVTAKDAAGNTATGSFTVTVKDTTRPDFTNLSVSPGTLTTNSHAMVPVVVTATATDNVSANVSVRIVSVTSDEAVTGTGVGDIGPDWEITGALTLNLRSERSDTGNGRVYRITVAATDAAGNTRTSTVHVIVPKKPGDRFQDCDDDHKSEKDRFADEDRDNDSHDQGDDDDHSDHHGHG